MVQKKNNYLGKWEVIKRIISELSRVVLIVLQSFSLYNNMKLLDLIVYYCAFTVYHPSESNQT